MLIDAAKSTLNIVDFSKPFDVFVDASEKAVSGILTQQGTNGQYSPIAFFSQKLNDTQRKWSTVEREWLCCSTIRYDMRCYFNVRSKADISQLNLPHGTDN